MGGNSNWSDVRRKPVVLPCRLSNIRAINFFSFNLEPCSFQVSNILVLRGAYCFFNHFDVFVRVAPQQQLDCVEKVFLRNTFFKTFVVNKNSLVNWSEFASCLATPHIHQNSWPTRFSIFSYFYSLLIRSI
jgi:hypothetical protein